MRYLDADTREQCLQAMRDGQTLDALAGKLHVEKPEHLGRLLQRPVQKPVRDDINTDVDLWAADRAHGQL